MKTFHYHAKTQYWMLSNLYGEAEARYQMTRVHLTEKEKAEILALGDRLEHDVDAFVAVLKLLQPNKKAWTRKQELYWTAMGGKQPIVGIVFKLWSGVFGKKTKAATERAKAFVSLMKRRPYDADLDVDLLRRMTTGVLPHRSVDDRAAAMVEALAHKFENDREAREYLLSTGDAELVELKPRGQGEDTDVWCRGSNGKGMNLAGQCLMFMRDTMLQR